MRTRRATRLVAGLALLALAAFGSFFPGGRPATGPPRGMVVSSEFETVTVPSGWFVMGCDRGRADEAPEHRVYLDAYEIDRYEVTNAAYARFVRATGRPAPRHWTGGRGPIGRGDSPVVGVAWAEARAYCRWVGKDLPTEAQWERACRGPDGRRYPWGMVWRAGIADIRSERMHLEAAWALLASGGGPGSVAAHPEAAGAEGVMGLVGGAAEWMLDWYAPDAYATLPARNPIGTGPEQSHAVRGIGWLDPYGVEGWVESAARCAARNASHSYDDPRVGFRCARLLPPGGAPAGLG